MYKIITNNEKLDIKRDKDKLTQIDYLCTDGHHAYNKVYNHSLFKDNIKYHIIDKAETCLVESLNSSMRDRLARLKRKSKAYSKSKEMLEVSIRLWINMKEIFEDIVKYSRFKNECVNEY